jgi:hypothetical protein
MSRTTKKEPYNPHSKENKQNRKKTNKKVRRSTKDKLKKDISNSKIEEIDTLYPKHKKTQGRHTW